MDKTQSDILLSTVIIVFAIFVSTLCILSKTEDINRECNHQDYNYKIDLKQDYFIIYDNHGKVDTVAHGELEEFIINDNM